MAKRIGILAGSFRPRRDGVAGYAAHLARTLARRGLDVTVLASRGAERPPGVTVRLVADAWRITEVPALAARVSALHLDALHVQYAPATFGGRRGAVGLLPGLLALLQPRLPLFVTAHEYGGMDAAAAFLPSPIRAALHIRGRRLGPWDDELLTLGWRARAFTTTSERYRRMLAARFPDRPVYLLPVPPNVLPSPVLRDVRPDLGIPRDAAPLVVYFGFLHPVKGLEYLIEGFVYVAHACPSAHLVLAGGSETASLTEPEARRYGARLRATVARCGLEGRVTITGYIPSETVSALLSMADLGVLPFTYGLSTKSGTFAAMLAHGLPVVGTRGPFTPEDDLPALLVPPKDVHALGDAMLRALRDGDLRRQLRAGAAVAAADLTWEALAERHLEIYGWAGSGPAGNGGTAPA